jgi:hypothetical protein
VDRPLKPFPCRKAFGSAFHQAHNPEKQPDRPGSLPLQFGRPGWFQDPGVVLQFTMAMRARIRVLEITQLDEAVRTF